MRCVHQLIPQLGCPPQGELGATELAFSLTSTTARELHQSLRLEVYRWYPERSPIHF